MSYRILILRRAQKELAELPAGVYNQAKEAIRALAPEPRPKQSRKLVSRHGWRMRVRDYRVIYEIDDNERTVTILHVGHRSDIYR